MQLIKLGYRQSCPSAKEGVYIFIFWFFSSVTIMIHVGRWLSKRHKYDWKSFQQKGSMFHCQTDFDKLQNG